MRNQKQKLQWLLYMGSNKGDPKTMAQGVIEETEETEIRDKKVEMGDLKVIRMEIR